MAVFIAVTKHLTRYNVREKRFLLAPWVTGVALWWEAVSHLRLRQKHKVACSPLGEHRDAEEREASAGFLSP